MPVFRTFTDKNTTSTESIWNLGEATGDKQLKICQQHLGKENTTIVSTGSNSRKVLPEKSESNSWMKIMPFFQPGRKNSVQGLMEKSRQQDPCYQQAPAIQNWCWLKRHSTTTENRRKVMERAPRGMLPAWWHEHQIPKCSHKKAIGYFRRRSGEEPTKGHIYLHLTCHRQFTFHFQFGIILQDTGIWWFTFIRAVHQFLVLNFGKWPIYWKNPILNDYV